MKHFLKNNYLPLSALVAGLLAFLMRTLLFASAMGEDLRVGLPTGTWPDVMSWILVAATAAFLIAGTWHFRGFSRYSSNFSASLPAALGMVLAAIGFLCTSVLELNAGGDAVAIIGSVLGFVSFAALGFLAFCRFKGLRTNILYHGVICLYLMFYLVAHYRLWSAYPQLQSYAFELLAIIFLMLSCYQRAAFDAGKGSRKAYTFHSLMALFFCIATLPGCDNPVFFIGSALWMLLTPCNLTTAVPRPEKNEE